VAFKPIPVQIFDRHLGRVVEEFMEDSPSTYESHPRRSFRQWLESEPLYDWLVAAYQGTEAGRVFLAGDSAHVMPPTGGFGGNTGIHDAHNLAWKIALATMEHSQNILDSYDMERARSDR
jgi:2-polyprenyl-6-methoxyphenol hydroxylase-like FAD-dependent oxidoreductase